MSIHYEYNTVYIFLFGLFHFQIYYETIRKIVPGEELLLGPRDPIQLDGMNEEHDNDGGDLEDADDSKHDSGAEETDEEDEDGAVKCIKCDKLFHDIFV